jgi:hypothetical protein
VSDPPSLLRSVDVTSYLRRMQRAIRAVSPPSSRSAGARGVFLGRWPGIRGPRFASSSLARGRRELLRCPQVSDQSKKRAQDDPATDPPSEKAIHAPDITGAIDSILERLKPNGQGQALAYANLLLTNLMTLLRPIRIKKQQPGGPRVTYTAEQLGLTRARVRLLKDSVFSGIKEIENGERLAASETFRTARESWHAGEQKPTPEAQGG